MWRLPIGELLARLITQRGYGRELASAWCGCLRAKGVAIRSTGDAPGQEMARVGKKAAGRLLDGREWNEYPEQNIGV